MLRFSASRNAAPVGSIGCDHRFPLLIVGAGVRGVAEVDSHATAIGPKASPARGSPAEPRVSACRAGSPSSRTAGRACRQLLVAAPVVVRLPGAASRCFFDVASRGAAAGDRVMAWDSATGVAEGVGVGDGVVRSSFSDSARRAAIRRSCGQGGGVASLERGDRQRGQPVRGDDRSADAAPGPRAHHLGRCRGAVAVGSNTTVAVVGAALAPPGRPRPSGRSSGCPGRRQRAGRCSRVGTPGGTADAPRRAGWAARGRDGRLPAERRGPAPRALVGGVRRGRCREARWRGIRPPAPGSGSPGGADGQAGLPVSGSAASRAGHAEVPAPTPGSGEGGDVRGWVAVDDPGPW